MKYGLLWVKPTVDLWLDLDQTLLFRVWWPEAKQIMGHMKELGYMKSALICIVSRLCLAQELSHWFLKTKTRLHFRASDSDIYCSWSGSGISFYPSISVILWQRSFNQSSICIYHRSPIQQAAVTRDSYISCNYK